jgi:hypothetical protein
MLARVMTFLVVSAGVSSHAIAQARVATDTGAVGTPSIETFCSRTRPRVGGMDITWSLKRDSLASPTLDFTVFKDGFLRDLFGTVDALGHDKSVALSESLRQDSVRLRPFRVDVIDGQADARAGRLRIESLEPGVNYFWRLRADSGGRWVGGETIRSQALTCPSDAEDEQ